MSIAIQVHGRRDPAALAELIVATTNGGVVLAREPTIGPLSAVVAEEERESIKRRAAWRWLNSISSSVVDHDNDWSDV